MRSTGVKHRRYIHPLFRTASVRQRGELTQAASRWGNMFRESNADGPFPSRCVFASVRISSTNDFQKFHTASLCLSFQHSASARGLIGFCARCYSPPALPARG
ncbi:hypothetical protein AAFF_G00416190 [Aldrovandia affinis]|uniref:Uncharacterized protein n=1 Tax=Aldrovandia affinis TaxID=143900 RepID=A0AAD7WJ88_9TELE|nr:hypothetical protein AAFF_G00416190 [Aldrovandia affinis]